ncbi:hypothetical protein, partial [Tolypothrix sp. VBCCA 56010]|uniref:hypothetical protein n=1 Tax=Tolypothrix sp. VBCCA 56010 TaxID=3137731 RepID=UPI003D7DAAA2
GGTLQLTPPTSTLYLQQSTTLTPSFNGSTLPGTSVVWSIQPGIGSINANGVFTAPAFLSAATNVVVTARLASNWNIAATATMTLLPSAPPAAPAPAPSSNSSSSNSGGTLQLTPPTSTLYLQQSTTLTPSFNGSTLPGTS